MTTMWAWSDIEKSSQSLLFKHLISSKVIAINEIRANVLCTTSRRRSNCSNPREKRTEKLLQMIRVGELNWIFLFSVEAMNYHPNEDFDIPRQTCRSVAIAIAVQCTVERALHTHTHRACRSIGVLCKINVRKLMQRCAAKWIPLENNCYCYNLANRTISPNVLRCTANAVRSWICFLQNVPRPQWGSPRRLLHLARASVRGCMWVRCNVVLAKAVSAAVNNLFRSNCHNEWIWHLQSTQLQIQRFLALHSANSHHDYWAHTEIAFSLSPFALIYCHLIGRFGQL